MDQLIRLAERGWVPAYSTDIPWWHGHMPFARTVIRILRPRLFVELGSHKGDSYMTFCESAQDFSVAGRFYAVDTWEGDQHVGELEPEIYTNLKEVHDERMGGFSTLLRMTFSEASERFEDGSVDLLHVDGAHTYDDVRRDVDQWISKLSDRGVMLMHDVAVKSQGFGVRQVFDELAAQYPTFVFGHSAGLGVVGVGEDIPDNFTSIFSLSEEENNRLISFYEALGEELTARIDTPENRLKVKAVRPE